ncbi:MAG TPA: leucyl aminopeptidase [Nevskiaceae bacterium]|nr:leucyl aminopeptidase [Nevskiaceae bacterium]
MNKSSAAKQKNGALKLHQVTNPLCTAGKAAPEVQVLLVGQDRQLRTAGRELPALPASFRGTTGERIEISAAKARLLVVGCGKMPATAEEPMYWESAGAAVIDAMRSLKIARAALSGDLVPAAIDAAAAARGFAIGATLASYRCVAYRRQPPKDHFNVESLALSAADWKAGMRGRELGDAVNWARALVDAPANLLHPQTFAAEIASLKSFGIEVEVLDLKALERIGAGGLLAVGRGSVHPPCMVICRWQGRSSKENDLGLVGKGLTFDAGGLNIKMPPGIGKMKFDMGGAAAVVGALRVMAQRKAPVNVVAALPLCENLIDADSYRPGDVITSLSGLTIEVDNTDAEGRIVLADGISHLINKFRPRLLVDVATLTGSIMASLHEEYAGLFSTDEALAAALGEAGASQGEDLWRMPLSKKQDYIVDSEIADVKNLGAPGFFGTSAGSAIAGAKFLERFAAGTRWAHLDIAGTVWITRPKPGIPKGATGFGVRLLDALADRLPA